MTFGSGGSRRAGAVVLALALGGGIAVLGPRVATGFFGSSTTETAPPPTVTLPDFRTLVERVSPAVVNISTKSAPTGPSFGGPGDPFSEFFGPFERFFGPPHRPYRQRSLGSGFVIDEEGFILTNNHVVENADEILVKLSNGKELKAKVVGRDAKTDLALIEIDGGNGLKTVPMGNSDELKVGDWVLAIGNPFGLDNTVTAGIVSAVGRKIDQGPYDNFIQTDAAINPGNSGGPLLNTRGEVVGINTAIFSRSGGNIGIGFAIPINLAMEIVPQLKTKGKVTRGWLGVMIQRITPELAESLGVEGTAGALVSEVVPDGPAAKAGLRQGDIIVEYDGTVVKDSTDLPHLVARTRVGSHVSVKVRRGDEEQTFTVTVGELDEGEGGEAAGASSEQLGLGVQTLTPEIAENLGLERGVRGVVVTEVDPDGPAAEAGIRRGDVIVEVNRRPVHTAGQYEKAVKASGKGKSVLFLVRRGDNTIFLAIRPSDR
ncbi:MAG TPA: DegQ family serine endoprotease [Candidatus Limnocylindria bacterium]|nr:DegQ family serine endoprotease [Candidatus Limnocylindria bacterium]